MKRVLKRLDKVHEKVNSAIACLDKELFQRAPADGSWSVAQIIQHLILVEARVTKELGHALNSPAARVGLLRRLIPTSIVASRVVRVKAPKAVSPVATPEKELAIEEFNLAHANLKKLCADYGLERFRRITFTHPFLGKIDGVAAVSFIGYHEQRHYKQIREVLRKLGN